MNNLGFTGRLSRWSANRRWWVMGGWAVLLVVITVVSGALGGVFTTDIEFTSDPESQRAKRLIEELRGSEPLAETVIVRGDTLTVDDPAFQSQVEALVQRLRAMPEEVEPQSVFSYYETGVEELVSADRRTTLIPLLLQGSLDESPEKVHAVEDAIHGAETERFTVLMGGFGSLNEAFNEAAENDLSAETRVLPVAFLILVLVFGAVVAAVVPMVIAGVAIMIAFGLVTIISEQWPLSTFVMNMVLLIGLAVGIDYALFIVERYREERGRGTPVNDSLGVAGDTATRAVLFSGVTVVIALMGLLIVPTNIFRSFGVGASIVVILSVVASLTLLPAILSLLGDRVNTLSIPLIGARRSHEHEGGGGFWAGIARAVMARPVISAVLSAGLLVVLAIPYFSIQLGASGAASIPESFEVRRAFEILNAEFSAGRLAPTNIVITAEDVTAPDVQGAVGALVGALNADEDIEVISEPQPNAGGDVLLFSVTVPGESAGDEAIATMKRIRNDYVPATFGNVDAEVLVGGQTALQSDFFDLVKVYTPIVFAFVLTLSFVLLLLVFRSLIVPIKAIIMNLLSVGAAYGVLVAIFQNGWLAGPLGFQTVPEIEAWLPLFMFTVLFGLSMDYHVFLLSRIRERFDETHNNTESVAFGVRSTANIITGAAAIMVAVFSGFALGELVMFQQIGVGLAVAVFLDATIVRTVLVPSTMRLLGDRNWYLPSWLRWLPDLRVERSAPQQAREAVAVR